MTLKLAAFQHFCARFADAFLTSLNPLTYESGDALQAFEEENEVHEPPAEKLSCEVCKGLVSPEWLENACNGKCQVVNRFGLSITSESFADLQSRLDAITEAERSASRSSGQTKQFGPRPRISTTPPSPSHIASPVCGEGPTGVCDIPPSPPVGHPTFQLPMFNASDLIDLAAEYILNHYRRNGVFLDGEAFLAHGAAEVVVSAITFELQGMAYDQSHPETQK